MTNTFFGAIITTNDDTVPWCCRWLSCLFFAWRTALIFIGAVFLTAVHESHVVVIIMILHHSAPLGTAGIPVTGTTGPWAAYPPWLMVPCKLLTPSWDCVMLGIVPFSSNHLWQDASPGIDKPITDLQSSSHIWTCHICIPILGQAIPCLNVTKHYVKYQKYTTIHILN